ncbi:MAG TPA: hypothetical protein VNS58_25210 [Puia sp.]|nr:hypothetical protein [Puia sp.]
MRKHLIISFLFLVFSTLSGEAQFWEDSSPFLVKSFARGAVQLVRAETSGGSIRVSGADTSDIKVEVYIQSNNGRGIGLSKEEIQKRLDEDYELTISLADNKLTATCKAKDGFMDWKRSLSVSFRIVVPQNVSTNLATSGGSIHLANLSGTQDFRTSGGSLHIDQLSGKIKGRTSGGSIHVLHSKDDIDLSTSGGSIEAADCHGKIKLATSGGSLHLNALQGDITASTSGGSVHGDDIEGELVTHTSGGSITLGGLSCSLEASTSGGNINVDIKELGKYVKLENSGGHIDLQIPKDKGLDLKLYGEGIKGTVLTNFSGSIDKNKIEGTLNGGGIPVIVDAHGGKLYLSFK